MIKVLLVDDHDIVRTGIRLVIEKMSGIKIVGECNDGYQALEMVEKEKPDVVLMEHRRRSGRRRNSPADPRARPVP